MTERSHQEGPDDIKKFILGEQVPHSGVHHDEFPPKKADGSDRYSDTPLHEAPLSPLPETTAGLPNDMRRPEGLSDSEWSKLSKQREKRAKREQHGGKRKGIALVAAGALTATVLGVGYGASRLLGDDPAEADPKKPQTNNSAPASPNQEPTQGPEVSNVEMVVVDPNALQEVSPIETDSQAGRDELSSWTESRIHYTELRHLVDEKFVENLRYNSDEFDQFMTQRAFYNGYEYEGNEAFWSNIYSNHYVFQSELYGTERPTEQAEAIGEIGYLTHEDFANKDAVELADEITSRLGEHKLRANIIYSQALLESKGKPVSADVLDLVNNLYMLNETSNDSGLQEKLSEDIEYLNTLYLEKGPKAVEEDIDILKTRINNGESASDILDAKVVDVKYMNVESGADPDDSSAPRQTFFKLWTKQDWPNGVEAQIVYDIALINAPVKDSNSGASQVLILHEQLIPIS